MKQIIILTIIFIVAGCASGPTFERVEVKNEQNSIFYIYRPYLFVGSAASPRVYINDEYIGTLSSGNYLVYEALPGDYEILIGKKEGERVNWAPDTILQKVEVKESEEYFLRMSLDFSDVSAFIVPMPYAPIVMTSGVAKISLVRMNSKQGLAEISKTKLKKSKVKRKI